METVISRDGTPIAFALAGHGEPIIFATGVFNDHTTCAPLAELLQTDHSVVTYDRHSRVRPGLGQARRARPSRSAGAGTLGLSQRAG